MASIVVLAALLATVIAQSPPYGQCGGIGWAGPNTCTAGWFCQFQGDYFSQCAASPIPPGYQVPFGQCAGMAWAGLTVCSLGYFCNFQDVYFSQCIMIPYVAPGSSTFSSSISTSLQPTSTSSSSKLSLTSPVGKSSSVTTQITTSAISSIKASASSSRLTKVSSFSSVKSSTPISSSSKSSSVGMTKASSTTISSVKTGSSVIISSTKASTTLSTSGSSILSSKTSSVLVTSTMFSLKSSSVSITTSKSTSSYSSSKVLSSSSSSRTSSSSSTSTTPPPSCSTFNAPPPTVSKVQFAGVNIPGCEFGGNGWGWQTPTGPSGAYCPLGPTSGLPDGPGQMAHFARDDKFNIFRLPVGWQFLTNSQNVATSVLDPTTFAQFDFLMQACLSTGAYCLIDFHNFARFNNMIIGQGGPSDALWAATWANIATKYKTQSKVMFGLMNEPHDIPDINLWANSCQAAVTAIRNAGATTQIILLPGNDWTSAQSFVSSGSGPALASVVNPDGSFANLVFDVHKYLDSDNSGTHQDCVDSYITAAFAPLAQWLRCNGRQAMLSEIGGGSVPSCYTYVCQVIAFLNANSDVYLGYVGWAAGSFDTNYILGETPTNNGGVWTDTGIVTQCLVPH